MKEIKESADRIIEGKRAKQEGLKLKKRKRRKIEEKDETVSSAVTVEGADKFLEDEINKIKPPDEKYLGVQIFTGKKKTLALLKKSIKFYNYIYF